MAVVPLTSLPTISRGLPLGDLVAEMKCRPSGPRSPTSLSAVPASADLLSKLAVQFPRVFR